jgi:flagellin-specific chaperone FliS
VYATAYGRQEYRQQSLDNAHPVRLIIMALDMAIQACEQRDLVRGSRAVGALRDSLNLDFGEAAIGFLRLYQWCLDCMRAGDYDEAAVRLSALREAWAEVEKKLNPSAPAEYSTALAR